VQHTVRRSAKRPGTLGATSLLAVSAAVLVAGCGVGDDMMATMGFPTSETQAPSDVHPDAHSPALATPQAGGQPNSLVVTDRQREYLNALQAAGVTPSRELQALSIGSYVCQARAAKQTDQEVWDFVLPLVRSDVRDTQPTSMPPTAAEIDAVTADYVRIATERLC
jgi:hypothetical protein